MKTGQVKVTRISCLFSGKITSPRTAVIMRMLRNGGHCGSPQKKKKKEKEKKKRKKKKKDRKKNLLEPLFMT